METQWTALSLPCMWQSVWSPTDSLQASLPTHRWEFMLTNNVRPVWLSRLTIYTSYIFLVHHLCWYELVFSAGLALWASDHCSTPFIHTFVITTTTYLANSLYEFTRLRASAGLQQHLAWAAENQALLNVIFSHFTYVSNNSVCCH